MLDKKNKIGYVCETSTLDCHYFNNIFEDGLKYFEYDLQNPEDRDIVFFADQDIVKATEPKFDNVKHKIAWLVESPIFYETFFQYKLIVHWVRARKDMFSFVFTQDKNLVRKYPDVFSYLPVLQSWISKRDRKMYTKNKLCSLASARKVFARQYLRFEIAERFKNIDCMGEAFDGEWFTPNHKPFKDYMYTIVVPNSDIDGYWDVHLTSPLSCGCVPIWKGSDISSYFNMDGIITFDDMDELDEIMDFIGEEDYNSRISAIEDNFNIVNDKYIFAEDMMWEQYLRYLEI